MFNINNNSCLSSSSSTSAAAISSSSAVIPSLLGRRATNYSYNSYYSRCSSSSSYISTALTTLSATNPLPLAFKRLTVSPLQASSSSFASRPSIAWTSCESAASSSSLAKTHVTTPLSTTHNRSIDSIPSTLLGIIGQYLGADAIDVCTFIASLPSAQQAEILLQLIRDEQSNSSIICHILHEAKYIINPRSWFLCFTRTEGIRQVPFVRNLFPTENAMNTFVTTFTNSLATLKRLECRETGLFCTESATDALITACSHSCCIPLRPGNEYLTGKLFQRLCTACPQVQTLILKNCYMLDDDDLRHLRNLPLRSLDLSRCIQITDTGLRYLHELPLERIWIMNTDVSRNGIQALQNSRPGIDIVDYPEWDAQMARGGMPSLHVVKLRG